MLTIGLVEVKEILVGILGPDPYQQDRFIATRGMGLPWNLLHVINWPSFPSWDGGEIGQAKVDT